MVRGYHVYKSIWDATCGDDILPCEREIETLTICLLPYVVVKKGTAGCSWPCAEKDFNYMFYIHPSRRYNIAQGEW